MNRLKFIDQDTHDETAVYTQGVPEDLHISNIISLVLKNISCVNKSNQIVFFFIYIYVSQG